MHATQEVRPFSPSASVWKKVQALIREIHGIGLETGRSLAYEELRTLPLDPALIDSVLRQIAQQRSTDGLVTRLESFAATLRPTPLTKLAAQQVDVNPAHDTLIPVDEILYLFGGGAVSHKLIHAAWTQQQTLQPQRVYVRTPQGIFLPHYRSLSELRQDLDPHLFLPIHQSLLVQTRKISHVELKGNVKQVSLKPDNGAPQEWLTVSRRYLKALRQHLGLPARG